MWLEKLRAGVLGISTPLGPRYIKLSFLERLYFVWVFRHFESLPQQVLSKRQQRLLNRLYRSQDFVSFWPTGGEVFLIGTIERKPSVLVDEEPFQQPIVRVAEPATTPLADHQGS